MSTEQKLAVAAVVFALIGVAWGTVGVELGVFAFAMLAGITVVLMFLPIN